MYQELRLNTSIVKQLCSTDEIQAEKKYKDPFHYVPSHSLVLYTNHLPRVGANDTGIWRRLIVIPFNGNNFPRTRTGHKTLRNYLEKYCEASFGCLEAFEECWKEYKEHERKRT